MTRPMFFAEIKDEDRAIRQHSSTNTRGVFLHSKFVKSLNAAVIPNMHICNISQDETANTIVLLSPYVSWCP